MKWWLGVMIASCCVLVNCDMQKSVKSAGTEDVLIRREFIDENTYRVVCRGFPEQGLGGVQRVESSKRAALLNAYYFIKAVFGDAVAPDREGKAEKFDVMADHAVVHYVVKKTGLKSLANRAPVTEGGGADDSGD